MCFSCICLFILHDLISVHFLFLLVSGIGCGCCTSCTFLLTVLSFARPGDSFIVFLCIQKIVVLFSTDSFFYALVVGS